MSRSSRYTIHYAGQVGIVPGALKKSEKKSVGFLVIASLDEFTGRLGSLRTVFGWFADFAVRIFGFLALFFF